jgi:hypothetical protein
MMYKLQDETRAQALARFHRDGGNEEDYTRSVPLEMSDGTIETLTHCQICRAQLENGVIKHLHYCPFEGAADRLKRHAPMLLAALVPFAACADVWDEEDADRVIHWSRRGVEGLPDLKITVGDLLAARTAIAAARGGNASSDGLRVSLSRTPAFNLRAKGAAR